MKYIRLSGALAAAGLAALLSGCVVAPIGPRPVVVYPAVYPADRVYPVYIDPAPVIVVPAPRHRGHHGYRGHRDWH